jgi:hypothetical protein
LGKFPGSQKATRQIPPLSDVPETLRKERKVKKKTAEPTSAIPLELPTGKFEIRLPATEENRAFYDECKAAWRSGASVEYQGILCRVYYLNHAIPMPWAEGSEEYTIGLVRAE